MPLPAHQKLFSIGEASSILNVSADTLRRSEKNGKIKTKRGKNNERLYSLDDVILLKGILKKRLPTQKMYSVKQTANLLNVSSQTIRRWEREGRIKAARSAGGHRRFTPDSIQAVKDNKYQQVQKITKDIIPTQPAPIPPTPYQPNFPVFKLISFATIGTLLVGFILLSLNSRGNIKSTLLEGIGNKIGKILPGYETDYKYEGDVKIKGTVTIEGIIEFLDSPKFTEGAVFSSLVIDNTGNLTTDQTITANSLAIVGAADMYRLSISSSLTVAGNEIINSSGKIPAINGFYFENLSGENITNVDAHHLGGQAASSFLRSNEPDTAEAVITFTASPGSVDVNGGPLYINPSASSTNYTLFGVAVDGVSKFKVDTEGDISLTGSIASTGARVTKGWFTDLEVTNTPTFGGIAIDSTFLKLDASNDPITGDLLLKPTSNSTTTFQVQKSDTTPVFNVDTTNAGIGVNTTSLFGSVTAMGGKQFGNIPAYGVASIGTINSTTGWLGNGFLFTNSTSGTSAFSLVFNNDIAFIGAVKNASSSDWARWNATGLSLLSGTNAINKLDVGGGVAIGTSYAGVQTAPSNGLILSGDTGMGTPSPLAKLHVVGSADDEQLIVQANSSQAANILEIQNSSNDVLSGVDERGILFSDGGISVNSVYIGSDAGNTATSDTASIGIGLSALSSLTSGTKNTALGVQAMRLTTIGGDNTAFGRSALEGNSQGNENTAIGSDALKKSTTGNANMAVGYIALYENTIGSYNAAIGRASLNLNTEGTHNTAVGYRSILSNTIGNYNVAIGGDSLFRTQTGSNNVAIGYQSIEGVASNSLSNNTAIGYQTGKALTTGSSNIFLGHTAGDKQTTLSDRLIIDNQTRTDAPEELTNSILYGVMAGAPTSQTLRINALTGINTTPSYALDVLASGTGIIARFNSENITGCTLATGGTISCTSDEKLKTNIEDLSPTSLSQVLDLHPVAFDWKSGAGNYKSLGFLAHEVESIFPGLVSEDAQTGYLQLNTISLVPVLTRAIQEQQNQINSLASQSASFNSIDTSNEAVSEDIATRVSDLEARILLLESNQVLGESSVATSSSSFLNSLAVLGDSVLGDTVITGKLDVGILSFDNLSGSIDAIGKLKLQSLALDSIEFVGGSIEMDQKGNLDIKKGVIRGNDSFRGSVVLVSGEMSVAIERIWSESPASVTATPNYNTNTWITDKTDKGFIIHVDKSSQTDQAIDWLAIW